MRYARLPERAFTQIQGLTNMYASVSSRVGAPFLSRLSVAVTAWCGTCVLVFHGQPFPQLDHDDE
jgi:hypothetical protein